MGSPELNLKDLTSRKISVYDPFADFLSSSDEEKKFDISLLDVIHFAGHACPSIVGSFLISQRVVKELFPETNVCVRGEVAIDIPLAATERATGPISNVFGYIFGAWGESGFGGLQGRFARRGLLRYSVREVPEGAYRFRNLNTGKCIDVFYDPSRANFEPLPEEPFQKQWRRKNKAILENQDDVLKVRIVSG